MNINDLANETPVVPLNNPPQISLGEGDPYVMSIDEDDDGLTPGEAPQFGYFVFDFDAIDFDGGQFATPKWSMTGADAGDFYLSEWTGDIFLIRNPDFETKSSYSFDIIASDGLDESSRSITLNINDLAENNPPSSITLSNSEGVLEGIDGAISEVIGSDPEGDTLSFEVLSIDDGLMLDIIDWYDTDLLIFKDNYTADYETDQYLNFTIRATDVGGLSYDQSFTLNVIDDVTDNQITPPPLITSPLTLSINENTSVDTLIYDIEVNQNEEQIFYYLSGQDRDFFNIDNNSGELYFKEIPDFEVKSSYDLVINATSHLLPFENFSNQVDRSTLIDESAFIIEELDGDIGFALFTTGGLSYKYPGGSRLGSDYPYGPHVTVGDAIDSFKSSAYYDENLGTHVTFLSEDLRHPFEDMNKFKVISRSELDVLNGEVTNPYDTSSFNGINLRDANWFDIFPNDLNSQLSDTKTISININDLNEDPVPPPPQEPEEPTDPLKVSVSDGGWNLYKDVLSDQFEPSEWAGIFGSSLSDNINRLINAQNLELSDRWASAEINPLDYLSNQLSVFNDTQSLQDDLSSRFSSIVESNTDLDIQWEWFCSY